MASSSGQPAALKVWAPGHGPRQVFFSVTVKLLHGVDCVQQRFSASVVVNFQWMLSLTEKERWEKDKAAFVADWQPPVVEVPTAIELAVEQQPVTVGLLGNMLIGKCSQVFKGTFLEVLELESFPFDSQEFKLTLVFPESEEVLQMHPSAEHPVFVRMAQDQRMLAEFRFADPVLELGSTPTRQLQEDFSVKEIRQPTIASRAWQSHAYKIILTLALLSAAVMFAFMLPHSELGDRLGHTTTLLLTAVAFQLVVSSSLPQLDYLTSLDKYIVIVNVYILLVMLGMTLVFWCTERECLDEDTLRVLDRYAMIASGVLWLVLHGWLAAAAALALGWTERAKLAEFGAFRGRRAAARENCTSSHYTVVDGTPGEASRVFFGNAAAYKLASKVPQDLTFWTGMWHSDDGIYGHHGVEYLFLSVMWVSHDQGGALQLFARKITGDENVPSGRVTWRTTEGVPAIGGPPVPILMMVRGDPMDKKGFKWIDGQTLTAVSADQLDLFRGGAYRGSFRRQGGVERREGSGELAATGAQVTERTPLLSS